MDRNVTSKILEDLMIGREKRSLLLAAASVQGQSNFSIQAEKNRFPTGESHWSIAEISHFPALRIKENEVLYGIVVRVFWFDDNTVNHRIGDQG